MLRLHRLGHHDGIVHHRSDDQHEGKERQRIQREIGNVEEGEGAHERNHDGHQGNQSGAPRTKEQQHDKYHECHGLKEGALHAVDAGVEEVLGGHEVNEFNISRQVTANLFHKAVDGDDDLIGVGTGRLGNHASAAGTAVDVALDGVALKSQFHSSHVLQAKHAAVRVGPDDEVLVVRFFLIAAAVLEYVLEGVVALLAEGAGGAFHVLLGEHGRDV